MPESDSKPLAGRIALVTGASRGIGYQAALGFAGAGAHVIAVARTVGGLEELDDEVNAAGGNATLVPLDLKDLDAIDRLGETIAERWGRLDILLGNAGQLGVATPLPHLKPSVFDDLFTVNVTANYRLIRAMDPLLKQSDAGRALFLTSGAVRSLRPYLGPYSASKAALEALVVTYAKEVETSTVRANLVDPGVLRTKMRAKVAPGEDPMTLEPPEAIVPSLIELSLPATTENGQVYSFTDRKWRPVSMNG